MKPTNISSEQFADILCKIICLFGGFSPQVLKASHKSRSIAIVISVLVASLSLFSCCSLYLFLADAIENPAIPILVSFLWFIIFVCIEILILKIKGNLKGLAIRFLGAMVYISFLHTPLVMKLCEKEIIHTIQHNHRAGNSRLEENVASIDAETQMRFSQCEQSLRKSREKISRYYSLANAQPDNETLVKQYRYLAWEEEKRLTNLQNECNKTQLSLAKEKAVGEIQQKNLSTTPSYSYFEKLNALHQLLLSSDASIKNTARVLVMGSYVFYFFIEITILSLVSFLRKTGFETFVDNQDLMDKTVSDLRKNQAKQVANGQNDTETGIAADRVEQITQQFGERFSDKNFHNSPHI